MPRFAPLALLLALTAPASAEPDVIDLFNGKDLAGWVTADGKPAPAGWVVEEGVLHRKAKAADIYTDKDFTDFDLSFEWKLAEGGNSGVKYRMAKLEGKGFVGFEYQVLDDAKHPDGKKATHTVASLYDLFRADDKKKVNPPGQWNTSRVVADGTHLQHFINGDKVIDVDTGTPAFDQAVAASKFKNVKGYGKNPAGRIMLQDHGDPVWYRAVKLKPLSKKAAAAPAPAPGAVIPGGSPLGRLVLIAAVAAADAPKAPTTFHAKDAAPDEAGFTPMFNGKDLTGWKASEDKESFTVADGVIVVRAKPKRSHLFYVGDGQPFKNFELRAQVLTKPNSNAGIYFHTQFQEQGWPKHGFECQVNNSYAKDPQKTGSLYAVVPNNKAVAEDDKWFGMAIRVEGKRALIQVDGKTVVDYTEPEGAKPGKDFTRVLDQGTFALQAHDPGSEVHFKDLRVKRLP